MKRIFIAGAFILFAAMGYAQNVGIGITSPKAKLNIVANGSSPAIPGATTSTAIFRIGVTTDEGIDFGKLPFTPFSAWMQAGFGGVTPDPISLQPLGGNVGIGILSPASSAKLDVSSTTQGFLPPRMTASQRNAIISPVNGLVVYCTDCGGGEIEVYTIFGWRNILGNGTAGPLSIGDNFEGGKIAYILQPGDPGYVAGQIHGLITAAFDQSIAAEWGCYGTAIPGADGTALGTGNENTIDIMAGCSTTGIAAKLCGDLVLNGFSDWYLPAKDELYKLYINRVAIAIPSDIYWSSSEAGTLNTAWLQSFNNGLQFSLNKNLPYRVRAVRAF